MRGRLAFQLLGSILIALWGVASASADVISIGAAADATLIEWPAGARATGAGPQLYVGLTDRVSTEDARRSVIRFDIASVVPAGSTITSVTLTLNMNRTQDTTPRAITLHTVDQAWGEGTSNSGNNGGQGVASTTGDATWLHTFYNTGFWTNPGGDFNAAASASTNVGVTGSYSWASLNMVSDVQAWLDTPGSNFGWLLLGNEINPFSVKRFASRENPTVANRPALSITFTPPAIVPEPGSVLLLGLGLGGFAALRRRRRSATD